MRGNYTDLPLQLRSSVWWIIVAAYRLSLVAESGAPLVVHGLLFAVASHVAENRLSFSAECGIFLDRGSNQYPSHCKVDS